MIPTSSTITVKYGHAVISTLKKKINNLISKILSVWDLGEKLKTVEDLMLTKDKIPYRRKQVND